MKDLIEQYAAGGEKLALAIRGLTHEDLLCAPPVDANVGKWSIQQVVIHVADADAVLAERMKRVISEDNPKLLSFDETKWAQALRYEQQSIDDAVKLVEILRRQLSVVLRHLPDEAFQRAGTHSEAGVQTLQQILQKAVEHLEHHVKIIHNKRAHWGKEMW